MPWYGQSQKNEDPHSTRLVEFPNRRIYMGEDYADDALSLMGTDRNSHRAGMYRQSRNRIQSRRTWPAWRDAHSYVGYADGNISHATSEPASPSGGQVVDFVQ